jgi:hypothetical protein
VAQPHKKSEAKSARCGACGSVRIGLLMVSFIVSILRSLESFPVSLQKKAPAAPGHAR